MLYPIELLGQQRDLFRRRHGNQSGEFCHAGLLSEANRYHHESSMSTMQIAWAVMPTRAKRNPTPRGSTDNYLIYKE